MLMQVIHDFFPRAETLIIGAPHFEQFWPR
jgi:hypothetical protein